MYLDHLDFEQPITDLEAKIEELRSIGQDGQINIEAEITKLKERSQQLTQSIFSHLNDYQIVQLARHPRRPYTLDYIEKLFTEFDELQGDRTYSKGHAIIGGIARFNGNPVFVLGHQRGRKTPEKIRRNFGMAKPEDYRKAYRLMEMAEQFELPLFTFIDTPGAYPGIDAEEHNQSRAIARNLLKLSQLKTPVICTVIGEGGSGGALGIGVGDALLMLEYSIYSVISPEGCAAILWKKAEKAKEAATAMGLTAKRLKTLGLIDEIIEEPLGGAHRDPETMAKRIKSVLTKQLRILSNIKIEQLVQERYERLMNYGE
jgi:acetyl-CoA carboxylase carboxyl transferase subunit alpha